MNEFREALERCQLSDLGFIGYPYTWNNKRPGLANTRQRLDRAIATESWKTKFPVSTLTHLFSHASDHLPIILHIRIARRTSPSNSRGFKFEESWLLWEDCKDVIHEAWNREGGTESGLARVKEKIASCGADLHAWGSSRTHPNTEKIKRLQKQVEALSMGELTEESKEVWLTTSKELDALRLKQEIYWAQRSRISWLKHGNKNIKFFHSKASQRKRRNFIQGIDHENNWVGENKKIAGVATNYFENMFKAGVCDWIEECHDAVHCWITPDMLPILSSEFSVEEIKAAIFQMRPTKAPRPDDMNAFFYQKF